MEKIVNLSKRRGFFIPTSEIYGGLASIYDYGPLGLALKQNVKNLWWREFVLKKDNIEGVDTAIIMHPKVWEASGHLQNFSDPMIECKKCHFRFREDHIERIQNEKIKNQNDNLKFENLSKKEMLVCPKSGEHQFDESRQFNLMFKTFLGATEEKADIAYLRPETAQGMFTNYKYILESRRKKIPFGIAQVGKCFRNELSLGNFLFRLREFEIAEIEYFVKPGEDDLSFNSWVVEWENFLNFVGLSKDNIRRDEKDKSNLAHYSKSTIDLQYKYPHGWDEIAGIANRTDYDLTQHKQFSGKELEYFDQETNKSFIPYVIEPTLGVERLILAILSEAYQEIEGGREQNEEKNEVILDFHYQVAPIKVAVFPLVKKDQLKIIAKNIFHNLQNNWFVEYDESGSIGRRYRRQDEIGTPFCITVDFDTPENNTVTVRDRRTMEQKRVAIDELNNLIEKSLQQNTLL